MSKGRCVQCGGPWSSWGERYGDVVCNLCSFKQATGLDAHTHPEEYGRWLCQNLPDYEDYRKGNVVDGKVVERVPQL